ncbi:hypothetical protein PSA7680_02899 [Pseudoruegeria aquimaris]|uniref:Hemerythrin-like domain-containing protein n=1 Tax=Pseudoruegeria aquimaris TaxID=393663 RepID=A0A1Y5T4D2_9RHOB|nr:hemerythrin domain-containing protein [Pseudoruegeria aquimaris]SLN55703.1 hypothetical protein PSA7680_02899 [Pseudoruegeria aquimaris]
MDASLDLARREGLPPALRVLLEEIPREGWEAHPAFGELVRFWLDRHLMFRRLTGAMQADVEALIDGRLGFDGCAPRLSRYGGLLLNELHGHHQIEDHHYFPRLARLDTRIERGFELLENDHAAMDGLLHGMADAANALLQGGEAGVFADQLANFTRLLDRHLVDEEDIIVPVILKSGFRG